jgi:hypothetical protein
MSERRRISARRIGRAAASVCIAVLATTAGACSSEPLTVPTHTTPVVGCEHLDIEPCNTLEHDCQVSRLELAACLRRTEPGKLPTVTYMTEQQYADYINATYASVKPPVPNHFEIAMTWLGLAQLGSFDFIPMQAADVADWFGTYRWRQKELLLIDHGRPADDVASNVELVSSLIRALRDRDIDIGPWTTEVGVFDIDSNWGSDAMYFGESQLFAKRYQAALDGVKPERLDEMALFNQGIREDIAWIRAQPSSFVGTNARFARNFGARTAYLAWKKAGVDGVNALYDTKSVTHQLMANETEARPLPALTYHSLPRASDEWEYSPTMTAIGAWGLFLSLGSLGQNLDEESTWSLALKWSGERLFVHKGVAPNQSETALIWQLEMADEESAATLEEALQAYPMNPQVRRIGSFVTLAISSNRTPLDWAFVSE